VGEKTQEKWIGENGVFWRKDFSPVSIRFTTTAVAYRCRTIFRDVMDCRAFSGYAMSAFFRDCPFSIHVKVVVFAIRPEQGYFFPDKKPGPSPGSTDEPVSWP
jgi:hypothetical protein